MVAGESAHHGEQGNVEGAQAETGVRRKRPVRHRRQRDRIGLPHVQRRIGARRRREAGTRIPLDGISIGGSPMVRRRTWSRTGERPSGTRSAWPTLLCTGRWTWSSRRTSVRPSIGQMIGHPDLKFSTSGGALSGSSIPSPIQIRGCGRNRRAALRSCWFSSRFSSAYR